MPEAALCLLHRPALDAENDVAISPAADLHRAGPIDHAFTAGATDRCAGYLPPLVFRLLDRNVLGVQVYKPIPANKAVYDSLYAQYRRLHDYFGRGENDVMKMLKRLRESVLRH